jgi:hypothetical protein
MTHRAFLPKSLIPRAPRVVSRATADPGLSEKVRTIAAHTRRVGEQNISPRALRSCLSSKELPSSEFAAGLLVQPSVERFHQSLHPGAQLHAPLLDRVFRKHIDQRFDWVMQTCGDVAAETYIGILAFLTGIVKQYMDVSVVLG